MIREILGVVADIIGVTFVWWQPNNLAWYWKLAITVVLIMVSVGFLFLSKNRSVGRVINYSWEDSSKPIVLVLNNNPHYCIDMLVSVYIKEDVKLTLCAIGHVIPDPEGKKLHVQIIHQVDAIKMAKIRYSHEMSRHYFVKPSVTQQDVSVINWK